jgi:DUF917 family protein
MSDYAIGIDVGGTHTDVVLLKNGIKLASAKVDTTDNVTDGITRALTVILDRANIKPDKIGFVKLGTTHLLNATLQNNLNPVAVIRLAFPATTAILPCAGWPEALKAKVVRLSAVIDGGNEYHGGLIREINPEQLKQIAEDIVKKDIHLVAIIGVFAHLNPAQELSAATLLKELLAEKRHEVKITLSHQMGGLGILERENATILNSALLPVYEQVCQSLRQSMLTCCLTNAVAFLSHNDGTIAPIDENDDELTSTHKPIFTLNAGQTNSMRGAAILAGELGVSDIMIADIGGTSTDIGRLKNGVPIEASTLTTIADICLNLETVQGKSIGLGGGSIIYFSEDIIKIGPLSVANHLKSQAISFGGQVLTVTDVAVYKRRIQDSSIQTGVSYPDESTMNKIDHALHEKLALCISEIWHGTEDKPKNLILVGGGCKLFDPSCLSSKLDSMGCELHILEHRDASVANALGAAKGQISGFHVQAFDYQKITRAEAEKIVEERAREMAISRGADADSLQVKCKREDEIGYVDGKQAILTIKVAGDIKQGHFSSRSHEWLDLPRMPATTALEPQSKNGSRVASDTIVKLSHSTNTLEKDLSDIYEVKARAIGCAFLGAGGGGDTRLAELLLQDNPNNKSPLHILPLDQLSDDANVISFSLMGSPSVIEEKLPSKDEIVSGFFVFQKKLGKKIDAIVTAEIGGLNGLFTIILVRELAARGTVVQLLDADCMGRALPCINMLTPSIFQKVDKLEAVLCNLTTTEIVEADSPQALEYKARALVCQQMGGVAYLSFLPMSGKAAKEVCIPGTLSLAKKMGAAFLKAKASNEGVFASMNTVLEGTDYEKIEEVFSGKIENCRRTEAQGFAMGGIVIRNDQGEVAELMFQNENLLVRKCLSHGFYKELECVPNLIIVVDKDTLHPISCAQLKYGQNIRILTMKSPKLLLRPEALSVVGREAFQLDKLCMLLNGTPSESGRYKNSIVSTSDQREMTETALTL